MLYRLPAVIVMWSAGKGIQALTAGFNNIYQVKDFRNFLMKQNTGSVFCHSFCNINYIDFSLQVFGNSLQRELTSHFPFMEKIVTMIISMRVFITLSALCLVFLLMYRLLPDGTVHGEANFRRSIFMCSMLVHFFFLFFFIY